MQGSQYGAGNIYAVDSQAARHMGAVKEDAG